MLTMARRIVELAADATIEWTILPDRPNNEVSEEKLKICGIMLRRHRI